MLKIWIGSIFTLVMLTAIFLVPDQVACTVESAGKVLPVREWLLIQEEDGALKASLRDHLNGTIISYSVNRFERGDVMQFALHPSLRSKRFIVEGDTVGEIYSNEIVFRLTELGGELATAVASLRLYEAGAKPALLEEAKQSIARLETQASEHQKVLDRLEKLYEQQLISDQELEIARGQQEIYKADIAIAEAQLRARQTGAQQEQIDVTATEIEALRNTINTLQERLENQTIRAPLSGYIARSFASDTMLTVRDTTGFIAMMPIPWKDAQQIETGAGVSLSIPETNLTLSGLLHGVGDHVEHVNGMQVVPAIAYFNGYEPSALPGIIAKTSIDCGSSTLISYLQRMLR